MRAEILHITGQAVTRDHGTRGFLRLNVDRSVGELLLGGGINYRGKTVLPIKVKRVSVYSHPFKLNEIVSEVYCSPADQQKYIDQTIEMLRQMLCSIYGNHMWESTEPTKKEIPITYSKEGKDETTETEGHKPDQSS